MVEYYARYTGKANTIMADTIFEFLGQILLKINLVGFFICLDTSVPGRILKYC